MNRTEVLKAEQAYFDRAWTERERGIADLERAPEVAIHKKAAADLRSLAKAAREAMDPNSPVAEGRFDTLDGETLYVGKHSVSTEDADLLVINWQAPAAAPFYTANARDHRGVAVKRTFTTERNKVLEFQDLVLEELAARVNELDEPADWEFVGDALLRDLERARTGEMQDIVQTITAAQYDIVSAPLGRLLVIQGGPGTGKSVIALHRVSWLLYNHRDTIAPRDVLVIGPNPTFARYIKTLLPSLGDADVVQQSLTSLGPLASHRRPEEPAVARVKGDPRMAGLLIRALHARIRPPADHEPNFVVATRAGNVAVPVSEVLPVLDAARNQPTYSEGRAHLRGWLSVAVGERATGTVRASATQIDQAVERMWPSLSPAAFLRELLGSRERLFDAAGDGFSAAEAGSLYRQSAERVGEETWSDTDVALLDEAEFLINGTGRTYAHIVVDEAQDLSPMQLRSLARRASGSLTVVGDLAQSTGAWPHTDWGLVAEALGSGGVVELRELAYGYRVPRQVMDLAASLLPIAAPHVTPPRVVRRSPEEPELDEVAIGDQAEHVAAKAMEYAGRGLSVGIIAPASQKNMLEAQLRRKKVSWRDGDAGMLGLGITLLSAKESKGLEFDAVVVMSPELIAAEDIHGHRLLYIALTRSTRCLCIVHSGDPLAHSVVPRGALSTSTGSSSPASQPEEPQVIGPVRVPRVRRGPAASTGGPHSNRTGAAIADSIVDAAVSDIVDALRLNIPSHLWPDVLERLRKSLEKGI